MTNQQKEITNLMLEYSDKHDMARAILEYRAVILGLMFLVCLGWSLFIYKCLV